MLSSPAARFWARQLVVAVVSYLAAALASGGGIEDWSSFGWGLAAAVTSTILGLLGPHEPFVGVRYQADVPVPPADPVPGDK